MANHTVPLHSESHKRNQVWLTNSGETGGSVAPV